LIYVEDFNLINTTKKKVKKVIVI